MKYLLEYSNWLNEIHDVKQLDGSASWSVKQFNKPNNTTDDIENLDKDVIKNYKKQKVRRLRNTLKFKNREGREQVRNDIEYNKK